MKHLARSAAVTLTAMSLAMALAAPASAITPALVRSVDEPARVPYGGTMTPTCLFANQCMATFPAVPAGKRLRVTAVTASVRSNSSTAPHLFALHRNDATGNNMLFLTVLAPQNAAYYGPVVSGNELVDVIFEAGQVPLLEIGVAAGAGGITSSNAHLTLTGYLVDVTP